MANYDAICPIRYPMKCNLLPVDKEALEGPGKYTAFFMYQFKGSDPYLKESIREYFKSPKAHLLDAEDEPATGQKLCKICRLILAADFGVASLSPPNLNVFMEVGMLLGVGKPVLYLLNPRKLRPEDIPFDLSGEIVIKHTSSKQLNGGLEKEAPLFLEKVRLYSEFQREFRKTVKEKLNKLEDKEKKMLRWLLLENKEVEKTVLEKLLSIKVESNEFRNLLDKGFLMVRTEKRVCIGNWSTVLWYGIHPNYRKILEEFLFGMRDQIIAAMCNQ
ncbi:MAG TPA: hypothetical protein ENI23_17985 [bacterium]|nr:hypothetical protein [bacterium]